MTEASAPDISERATDVRERIRAACERAGRDPESVTLVAVSKTVTPASIMAAWAAGITDFGENRIQEAAVKLPAVLAATGGSARFHLIGHLQTNKVAAALDLFSQIHSVDSKRLLQKLAARALQMSREVSVMIQVNVSGEESKFGVPPDELTHLISEAAQHPMLKLTGLMTVPPRVDDPNLVRPLFAMLRELAAKHRLRDLSMGMTEDYEVAIEEGATHVRVGRAIFGERPA